MAATSMMILAMRNIISRLYCIVFLVLAAALPGCTMEGKIEDKDRNRVMACKDLRDGETFEFNTNTMRNIRVGLAGTPTSATLTDSTGKERTITSDQEAYIKCKPKE